MPTDVDSSRPLVLSSCLVAAIRELKNLISELETKIRLKTFYQGCFWHCIRHNKWCLSWQAFDIYRGCVSGEARLPSSISEYKLLSAFEFIKAISDTGFDMINAVYHDKHLIFIRATFREKLFSQHQAMNINCWVRLSLSRLFLTLYLTR